MIYLHFLDRELRESIDAKLDYKDMAHIIRLALFMPEKLYMAYSHFFETCKYNDELEKLVLTLNKFDLLDCITSHNSYEDFINTHKTLYAHDKERYPYYFDTENIAPNLTRRTIGESTTKILWSQMLVDEVFCDVIEDKKVKELKDFIYKLGDKAVTKAAFVTFLDKFPDHQKKELSKKINLFISNAYTKKYLGTENHLVTGIEAINHYDYLESNKLLFDFNIYDELFKILNITVDDSFINTVLKEDMLDSIKIRLKNIILESIKIVLIKNGECNKHLLIQFFSNLNLSKVKSMKSPYEKLFALAELISGINNTTCNICDCLILCATDEELSSITAYANNFSLFGSVYLCREGDKDIILLKVGMGMVNSAVSTSMAIKRYNPKCVIMVGFCAGNKDEVKLGDIIIANKLFNYSTGKQISESEIQNEQEVILLKMDLYDKISTYKDKLFISSEVDLPKDFDLQLWEFLTLLSEGVCKEIDKFDSTKFPDLEHIIEYCRGQKLIDFYEDKIKINKNGTNFFYDLKRKNPHGVKQYEPQIRFGVMACGSYVQQQENIFGILKAKERKTIALDMESYSVANAAEKVGIPFLIIKGVGDYANDHKKFANRFIRFSTYNSFFIAMEIIKNCDL